MADTPFDLDDQGRVLCLPVFGWTTAPLAGITCLLRLEYAETPQQWAGGLAGRTAPTSVQLSLTAEQAADLGTRLLSIAQHLLAQTHTEPRQ